MRALHQNGSAALIDGFACNDGALDTDLRVDQDKIGVCAIEQAALCSINPHHLRGIFGDRLDGVDHAEVVVALVVDNGVIEREHASGEEAIVQMRALFVDRDALTGKTGNAVAHAGEAHGSR